MTKKDIVKTISAEADLTQLKVKEIVQRTFDEIIETLVRDGKIELRNFGVFKVKKRAGRPARNPRTTDPVYVPEKCVVTFKPGKEMAARIRSLQDVPGQESTESVSEVSDQDTTEDRLNHPGIPEPTATGPNAPAIDPSFRADTGSQDLYSPGAQTNGGVGGNDSDTTTNPFNGD